MNQPNRRKDTPVLKSVENLDIEGVDHGELAVKNGSGGPPAPPYKSDTFDLWFTLVIGLILTITFAFLLSHDPAAQTYGLPSNSWLPGWARIRVFFELSVLAVGFGCFFIPATSLILIYKARKIERLSNKQIRSLHAKKLESAACEKNASMITKYILALLDGRVH